MRLEDVLMELRLDPKKEFISNTVNGRDVTELKAKVLDGIIIFECTAIDKKVNCINLNREWEEVKEPVTFMEAVKSGKEISVEYSGANYKELSLVNMFYELQQDLSDKAIRQIILNGKWYIED